jgi:hypothetical protein
VSAAGAARALHFEARTADIVRFEVVCSTAATVPGKCPYCSHCSTVPGFRQQLPDYSLLLVNITSKSPTPGKSSASIINGQSGTPGTAAGLFSGHRPKQGRELPVWPPGGQ